MGLFQTINFEAHQRKLEFLVIGGLAVNLYGYSRDTADLDLLIQRDFREQWLALFAKLNYAVEKAQNAFIQMAPPKDGAWPVDLMMVNQATFQPMFKNGRSVEMYGERLLIPCLEHLIALKLHALKHTHLGRFLKDFLDVENLIRINRLNVRSENIRQLFAKYGTMDLYEKVSAALDRA